MEFKKLALGFSPTPIHELSNLSKLFEGYRLFIKRDDNNGLGTVGIPTNFYYANEMVP